MHVLHLTCLVDWDRRYLLGSVGCACAAVEIRWICAVAVLLLPFTFCVNYCGSMGVIVGMSGESWCHKSTLCPIPGSQDWAYRSYSLLLSFLIIYLFIFKFIIILIYIYLCFYFYVLFFNIFIIIFNFYI